MINNVPQVFPGLLMYLSLFEGLIVSQNICLHLWIMSFIRVIPEYITLHYPFLCFTCLFIELDNEVRCFGQQSFSYETEFH